MAENELIPELVSTDYGDAHFLLHYLRYAQPHLPAKEISVLHSHTFYELHIARSGFYTFMNENGLRATISRGQGILIPPNFKHFSYIRGQNGFQDTVLTFSVQKKEAKHHLYAAFTERAAALCFQPLCFSEEMPEMTDSFIRLQGHSLRDALTQKLLAANIIYALLEKMHLLDAEETAEPDTSDGGRSLLLESLMDREHITLSEIAAQMNFSERHMARIIKEQYGVTFTEYRQKRRLNVAKAMLESAPELSVAAVCMMSGLNNETLFYRLFRAEYGITPGEFKANLLHAVKAAQPTEDQTNCTKTEE